MPVLRRCQTSDPHLEVSTARQGHPASCGPFLFLLFYGFLQMHDFPLTHACLQYLIITVRLSAVNTYPNFLFSHFSTSSQL